MMFIICHIYEAITKLLLTYRILHFTQFFKMFYKTLQFCYCKVSIPTRAGYSTIASSNKQLLMDIFGLTTSEAELIMIKHKTFQTKEPDQLIESYNFCKKIGITNNELLIYPTLLTTHPVVKFHHYKSLEEAGCKPIDAKLLSRASKYKRGKISMLKSHEYLEPSINVADQFLSYLEPPIEKPKVLDKSLKALDAMTWSTIHMKILIEWLKVRLKATDEDMIKLFRIHKMIQTKSFRVINENITLAESVGLSHMKILKCGYLLNNYPEYPKTVWKEFPNLAGLDMRRTMRVNPKLMMVAPKKILMVYGILKEFNIPDESIRRKHQVFCMNTDTLRFRLNEMNKIPEFKALMRYPSILQLVIHHNKAKSKLSFLHSLQLKCASFSILGDVSEKERRFDSHIKEGRDVNSKKDVITFFSLLFEKTPVEIKKKIECHPYSCYVPYTDIQDTYDYLTSIRYTRENIYRSMLICLYPKAKIAKAIEILKADQDVQFCRLNQWKQLHLVLYQIEKEHHFTGNGIWNAGEITSVSKHVVPDEKTLE